MYFQPTRRDIIGLIVSQQGYVIRIHPHDFPRHNFFYSDTRNVLHFTRIFLVF